MRKPTNWWWFLTTGGIVLPALLALIIQVAYIPYLHNLFISGTNPILLYALNFFILSFICLLFKLIDKIILNSPAKIIAYIITGIVCIYFFSNQFFRKYEDVGDAIPRRYIGTPELFEKEEALYKYYLAGYSVIIIIIFLYFFARNFPYRKTNYKDNSLRNDF
jgi:hypothetical protein